MLSSPLEFDDEDELSYARGLPPSVCLTFDPDRWEGLEWARRKGHWACNQRPPEIEGAWFVDLGDACSLLGMKGAQYLHSDRHMLSDFPDQHGHCWNAVVDVDGDQMLLVRETEDAYRHHRLEVGALIYFNAYQTHLVSRSDPQDRCVIVQVGGIGPDEPERALEAMGKALEQACAGRVRRAAA
ncbi:hypothetical protein [Sphingomonas sp. 3-13AW]|uniref:hypothetical protein n=1 Tax=Sphingomonas sp. 3-13AW TaxID=3050450 RepID=UPI003BB6BB34